MRGWQLAGNSAEAYQTYLVPAIMQSFAHELASVASFQPGERILDVACGTGVVARAAVEQTGGRAMVVGLDVNPEMLAVARKTPGGQGVEWKEGDALDLPFADNSFDVVTCGYALMFLSNRLRALQQMRRVMAPDGRVVVMVARGIEDNPGYARLAGAFARVVGDEAGAMMRSIFSLGDRGELEQLARAAGFGDVRIRFSVVNAHYPSIEDWIWQEAASSPLADQIAALDEAAREALVADLSDSMAGSVDSDGIAIPFQSQILLARA
jgi:ubiquinone/menaquinone biosynthesis C-methylase UbiE